MDVRIEPSWQRVLKGEFEKFYFESLTTFIRSEYRQRKIYPPGGKIFCAFDLCPFDQVRVVILGQDPYHGEGQAEGLAFSVPEGVEVPPSLRNILTEIASDLGHPSQIIGGHLTAWCTQGVLLLNATLTVVAHKAGSHQGRGWETFTDQVISLLSNQREHLVFMLWGSYARHKRALIDPHKHLVLEAPHPSPLSAHRGFFGCRHFSKANAYLTRYGYKPIDW